MKLPLTGIQVSIFVFLMFKALLCYSYKLFQTAFMKQRGFIMNNTPEDSATVNIKLAFDAILDALPYSFIIITVEIIAKDTSSIFLNKLLTMIFVGFFFFLTACASFCSVAAFYTFIEVEDIILKFFTVFFIILQSVVVHCDIIM